MVRLKKKVTIRVKTPEPPIKTPAPKGSGGIRKLFVGTLLLLVVIGAACWYVFYSPRGNGNTSNETANVAQSVEDKLSDSPATANAETKGNNDIADETETEIAQTEDGTNDNASDIDTQTPSEAVKSSPAKSTKAIEERTNSGNPSSTIAGNIEQKANDVIRGIYGNGQVRKEKLGNEYQTIQDKVNEMYRKGLVQ